MTEVRWWPIAVAVLMVMVAVMVLVHWFGGIADDLRAHERALDVREQRLEVWSKELERIDTPGVKRARRAAGVLDRAFGPAPSPTDEERLV